MLTSIYDFYSGNILFLILEIEDFSVLEITLSKREIFFPFLTKRPNPKQNWDRKFYLKPNPIYLKSSKTKPHIRNYLNFKPDK